MSDDQILYFGVAGDGCSLLGGAVEGLLGSSSLLIGECGLVVQKVDSTYLVDYRGAGGCVRAVCVAARTVGGRCQSLVGDNFALGCHVVLALAQLGTCVCGNLVKFEHVRLYVSLLGLFAYEESSAGYSVVQWQCLHGNCLALEDYLLLLGINVVENNFVGHSFAEKLQLRGQQSAQHGVGVNVQR